MVLVELPRATVVRSRVAKFLLITDHVLSEILSRYHAPVIVDDPTPVTDADIETNPLLWGLERVKARQVGFSPRVVAGKGLVLSAMINPL